MGFTLHWSEEDIQDVTDEYSSQVSEVLEKKLEEKKEQIKWARSIVDVSKRVHNTFGLGELHIAEIRFGIHGRTFRTLCHILSDRQGIVYIDTVDKKQQERVLRSLQKRSTEMKAYLTRKYYQSSS